jgi:hypothetical protein
VQTDAELSTEVEGLITAVYQDFLDGMQNGADIEEMRKLADALSYASRTFPHDTLVECVARCTTSVVEMMECPTEETRMKASDNWQFTQYVADMMQR